VLLLYFTLRPAISVYNHPATISYAISFIAISYSMFWLWFSSCLLISVCRQCHRHMPSHLPSVTLRSDLI